MGWRYELMNEATAIIENSMVFGFLPQFFTVVAL
jgi:hypothetical protein